MKNLFDFATKELSQDAFLIWLFQNYDCENDSVKKVSYDLINYLLGDIKIKYGDIDKLDTWAQWKRIDVLVQIHTKDNKNIVLVIEDKTFSGEHNQLKDYSAEIKKYYIDKHKNDKWIIKTVFYKTDTLNKHDVDACVEASTKFFDWKYYFIDDIYNFYSNYSNTGSEVLDFYIDHIKKLYKIETKIYSDVSLKEWKYLNFKTYFDSLCKKYKEFEKNGIFFYSWDYLHIYRGLSIVKQYDRNDLILEIDGREYNEGESHIKILLRDHNKKRIINHSTRLMYNDFIYQNICQDENGKDLFKISSRGNTLASRNKLLRELLSYDNSFSEYDSIMNNIIKWFISLTQKNLKDIEKEYYVKEYIEPKDFKYIIIKVRDDYIKNNEKSNIKDARYETTRKSWKVKEYRLKEYKYIFSVTNGIVRDIYTKIEWKKVGDRFEFTGKRAFDSKDDSFVRSNYIDRKIPECYRQKGMSYPVLYSKNKLVEK